MMILQVLPSIAPHDAISQHVLRCDDELKSRGIDSGILAHHIHPSFSDRVMAYNDIDTLDGHHIVYHMSIASALAEKVHSANAYVDVWYHNITPAEFFEPWEPFVSLELRIARHQLLQMAVRADRGVAASRFSEKELREAGCRHTSIMPVLFEPGMKVLSQNSRVRTRTQFLSVGRFAPHKKVERLISALAMYRDLIDETAVLHLVGTSASRWYKESLDQLIASTGLNDAVIFHEGIGDVQLAELYGQCDAYLCMSEHEGFCVPLVEAQYAGLPIVALDFAAIPETVNGAGIVLPSDASLIDVVAALDIVVHDEVVGSECKERARHNVTVSSVDEQAREAVSWLCEVKV